MKTIITAGYNQLERKVPMELFSRQLQHLACITYSFTLWFL